MANKEVGGEGSLPEPIRDLDIAGQGKVFTILHCRGALKSYEKAISGVGKKKGNIEARLSVILSWLGDNVKMSKDSFPQEGLLPDGGHFRALKKIPVRAYLWRSKRYPHIYFISHYIYKKRDELHKTDTQKVCNNWRSIEEEV